MIINVFNKQKIYEKKRSLLSVDAPILSLFTQNNK